jgi:CRP-like cAMP-binding protein
MEPSNYFLPDNVLSPSQVDKINKNSFIVSVKKGERIYSQDKPVSHLMFLISGLVKIHKEGQKNRSVILRLVGPGNYIGLFSVFFDIRYHFSSTALEDSEIIFINFPLFSELISESGPFAFDIIKHFSKDGIDLMNKLIYYPQKQVPGRIAEVLLNFAFDIYKKEEFILPLSRQELADLVYSTKESVSRTLTEFKNDRMIELNDRYVSLKSIDLLKMLSKLG